MSTDPPDLAASRPQPGPEAPRAAESPYTPAGPADHHRHHHQQEDAESRAPTQPRHDSGAPSELGQSSPSPPREQQQSPRTQRRGSQTGQPEPDSAETWKPPSVQARDIVRLFQCRLCSNPYRDAVTLPCGRSICKSCLPETHARASVTYPALPNRMQAFRCPFPLCNRDHVLDDCGADVILNKVASIVGSAMERYQAEAADLRQSTSIAIEYSWDKAGIGPSERAEHASLSISGTRLVATWTLAARGALDFEAEVAYPASMSPPDGQTFTEYDAKALGKLQQVMRTEMDCQICYALFHDPLTTGCGHTFCRPCLHRILDHSRYCPICRRKLAINPLLKPSSCPSNERVTNIIETFWKDEMMARREAVTAEHAARHQDLHVPLFICTLSFPTMPTFLHVFEPRYRLMIRRALEENRTFGMVLPRRPRHSGDAHFHELGTLLRIVNAQFYPDGRSLLETVGLSRFRVGQHGHLDGYVVGRTERIHDVSLEEEEAIEAAEVGYDSGVGTEQGHDSRHFAHGGGDSRDDAEAGGLVLDPEASRPGASPTITPQPRESMPQTAADLDTMTTQSLMQFAVGFVARMREQNVPWLTERTLAIYGACPEDPAVFPWWFASMLPVHDHEKYRLLETLSVRDRLKICGSWIIEMEKIPWSFNGCTVL
ncbi:hypothetical protein G6O67_008804 [Ophiocordyceps sinensis]|uniref:ATP-dependent protease La domain-containing protein n=1 Tax=Ophiocordyceps sinensis TaxID=72228 RepID=A0A8H4LPJ0_9HYPO|nr:hypothetical protein G6O67_008804 [Ophiocordyceps sinensis]